MLFVFRSVLSLAEALNILPTPDSGRPALVYLSSVLVFIIWLYNLTQGY